MIVQFNYVTIRWSPPQISEEGAWAMGEQVDQLGKAHFRREFRRKAMRSDKAEQRKFSLWAMLLLIGLMAVCFVFIPMTIPIVLFVLLMYFGSLGIALLRYDRWLSKCLAVYQRCQRQAIPPAARPIPSPPPPNPNAILFQPYEEIAAKYPHINDLGSVTLGHNPPVTTTLHSLSYPLATSGAPSGKGEKSLTMTVEVWSGRIESVLFTNGDSDLNDDDVDELLKANSGGVTWGTNPAQPQFFFRSDNKAVASYGDGRRTLQLMGRELISARAAGPAGG